MTQISRRAFLRYAGTTAAALLVAACAPAPAQPQPAPTPEAEVPEAAPAAPVKLELWTFVNTHARWFLSMADDFKGEVPYDFELNAIEIAFGDMHDRTLISLQAGGVGAPDIVDLEQSRFGGFLRGTGDPGLVDLTDWLAAGGYMDKLVATRQALYTYKGKTYGVEHALCPVVLYYRSDVFEEAGIDVTAIATWDDWEQATGGLADDQVSVLPFPTHEVLLRQRGSDYFDAEGNVTLDSDDSIATMEWILALRDQYGIGRQPADFWAEFKEGHFLAQVGADWFAGFFKDLAPELSGKMMAMPLPAWQADGLRTSCHGGTGCCIVRFSEHVDVAWDFVQYSMLSVEGNVRRFEMTRLFPPFIPAMEDPRLHAADEYFSDQNLGGLFAELGPTVPAQHQSPYRAELNSKLGAHWQDLYDLKVSPANAFGQVAESIREVMIEEGAL